MEPDFGIIGVLGILGLPQSHAGEVESSIMEFFWVILGHWGLRGRRGVRAGRRSERWLLLSLL